MNILVEYDACMNIFTEGQVIRMNAIFDEETGARRQMQETAEELTSSCVTQYYCQKQRHSPCCCKRKSNAQARFLGESRFQCFSTNFKSGRLHH